MAVSLGQFYGKVKAYVDALCNLPRSQYAAAPSSHYGQDYNALRKLALEVLPDLDERLLGKCVTVRPVRGDCAICEAQFVEIETYARQIMQQLAVALGQPVTESPAKPVSAQPPAPRAKPYDIEAIRREYSQAYAPWSAQDDDYLQSRFLEGATIDDLVSEFARQPSAIRSRLRKLGLDVPGSAGKPIAAHVQPAAGEAGSASPSWRDLRPRMGRAWTADEDAALLREFDAGLPLAEIARSLGRGVFSIEVRLCKLGRSPPKRS